MEESRSPRYQLSIIAGPDEGRTIPLPEEQALRIGRDSEADLTLNDAGVSRDHCLIQVHKGEATIIDAQSRAGTKVNGQTVQEVRLRIGDTIELGETVLRFQSAISSNDDTVIRSSNKARSAPVPRRADPYDGPPPVVVQLAGNEEPDELVREKVEDLRERRESRREHRHDYRADRKANFVGIIGFALGATTLALSIPPLFQTENGNWFSQGVVGCLGLPLTVAALLCSIIGSLQPNRDRIVPLLGVAISLLLILYVLPTLWHFW